MLKIRLKRTGKKHQPHYRVVVTEARSRRDGRPVVEIGSWHPSENKFVLAKDKYDSWLQKGAQPTQSVVKLVNKD